MYSTMTPCWLCASLIANSNVITAFFYDEVYRDKRGLELLQMSEIVTVPTRSLVSGMGLPTLERLRASLS